MQIPIQKVKIDLVKADPTQLTIEDISQQLKDIGLGCELNNPATLEQYRKTVESQWETGTTQSYSILKPAQNPDGGAAYQSVFSAPDAPYLGMENSSTGDWEPKSTNGFTTQFSTIMFPEHFDYLMKFSLGFSGRTDLDEETEARLPTVDAIVQMFVQVGTKASATLINGINKTTLNSMLSNAIEPIRNENLKDYDQTNSRLIFLVENYDPVTQEADAIGALSIDWRLQIKDYKKKKSDEPVQHDVVLTLSTRSVLYDSVERLEADVQAVKDHFGNQLFSRIPIPGTQPKVFDTMPPANQDSFDQGVPLESSSNEASVMILFAPDLQNIASIDNSQSAIQSSYSQSVTTGFTFSSTQSISTTAQVEVSVEIVKASVSTTFGISFTEQYNTSKTESMTFTVPGGKSGFVYQGYIKSAILTYYPESGEYKYGEEGLFMTNLMKTTDTPVTGLSG